MNNDLDRKYLLTYERVSTDDQKNTPSCADQKTVNNQFIDSSEFKLGDNGDYRDEGLPGSTLDRPQLQDLLIRCEEDKTIKGVVVTETDRLARGNDTYIPIRAMLKKFGVKVFAVTQPMVNDSEEGEMIGEILAAINGFFSKLTRRKSMRALDQKAERGWYPSWAPLGYLNVNVGTEEKPDRIIQVDENNAPYVRLIPKLYNQGMSYDEISEQFYKEGLRGKSGGKVSPEEIRHILMSDFYLGDFRWRGKKYHGNHTPLFTNYLEIQRARNRSHEKAHVHTTKDLKNKFIFKKLPMFCYNCKITRITAESKIKHYRKREAEYLLYHCTKSLGGWQKCTQPTINEQDLILEFAKKAVRPVEIGEDLAEFLFEEMNRQFTQGKEERQRLLDTMNRRTGQIDTELKNLFEMRVAGQIAAIDGKSPQEVYEEYTTKKEQERKNVLGAIAKLEMDSQDWKQKASNFFSDCCNAETKFLDADDEKQYLFLRRITSNAFLDNKQLIVTHQIPFNYLLKTIEHPSGLPSVRPLRTFSHNG